MLFYPIFSDPGFRCNIFSSCLGVGAQKRYYFLGSFPGSFLGSLFNPFLSGRVLLHAFNYYSLIFSDPFSDLFQDFFQGSFPAVFIGHFLNSGFRMPCIFSSMNLIPLINANERK